VGWDEHGDKLHENVGANLERNRNRSNQHEELDGTGEKTDLI